MDRIKGIGEGQDRIKVIIGFAFGAGLTGALHPDVAVGVDKGRGHHVEVPQQFTLGGLRNAADALAAENKMLVMDNGFPCVNGLRVYAVHLYLLNGSLDSLQ